MKPQHLLFAAPFAASGVITQAFVNTSNKSFVTKCQTPSLKAGQPRSLVMDTESDIDIRTRKAIENKLRGSETSRSSILNFENLGNSVSSIEDAESAHGMPWCDTIGKTNEEEPLLYMPFWEWQIGFMKETLTNLRPDDCANAQFGYKENLDKKARIVNHCYQSNEYRKIRMTYYDAGDNTQVFNSVWYPDPAYNLPVLGIDLLSFNRKKYLAIVDFQPLHEDESDHATTYEDRLKPIKNQYESLKGRMSSKFYDETQFFSEQMLFARFDEEKVVHEDLFPAFKRYVMLHNKLIKETEPDYAPKAQDFVLERQSAYDTYSAERDPATALFAAMFGKEWADDFVFDFLFSSSEKKEGGLVIPPMFGGGGGGPPPSHAGNDNPSGVKPQSVTSSSSR